MEEMSIAELKERLEFNKRKLEQEVDFKRETNLTKKEEDRQKLMGDAKLVDEARQRRKEMAEARRLKLEKDKQHAQMI